MYLSQLHQGISIPEHSTVVPWLSTRKSLYQHIPRKHFGYSPNNWPILRFTCLGIHADFAFNFASHPEGRLVELQMLVDDSVISTINGLPVALSTALGRPTREDTNDFRWYDEQVVVDCWVCVRRHAPYDPFVYEFSRLALEYSAGWPKHWNNRIETLRT
jgi:hypothetical protein